MKLNKNMAYFDARGIWKALVIGDRSAKLFTPGSTDFPITFGISRYYCGNFYVNTTDFFKDSNHL